MLLQIEKYLFYILLFSIPFQARKILWYPSWRFVEWNSISIYATDILLMILLCLWLYNSRQQILNPKSQILNKFQFSKSKLQNPHLYLFLFIIFSAISIKNSSNPEVSWYYLAKLVEFAGFYFYLSRYAFSKFGLVGSFYAIFIGGLFQAVIAIIQFLKQSDIGLRYLGESVINSEIGGVASFYISSGEKIIRAYGTTPHPNVLAGFLFLALFSFYAIYLYSDPKKDKKAKLLIPSSAVILFALFTTFSRVIIFAWFVTFCIRSAVGLLNKNYRKYLAEKSSRRKIKAILISSLVVIVLFNLFYFEESLTRLRISGDDQAVQLRVYYVKETFESSINLFGAGIGNSISWLMENEPFLLRYQYQPIHNIYLLIYSEIGILGLMSFILFLAFLVQDFIKNTRLNKFSHFSFLVFLGAILFIGFFDHFLWTLQQGRFILWFTLASLTFMSKRDIL